MPPLREIAYLIDGDCHICTSHAPNTKGYPVKRRSGSGKLAYISHLIFEQNGGEVPQNLVVRHTCDNPGCINLEHLILGTQADNIRDMDERGRRGGTRLSPAQVVEIFESRDRPVVLAAKYGISSAHVCGIKAGRIHKRITKVNQML